MSEYKLVPFEPTPEMVSAAEDAYMPFGDMDLALRMAILAAPAVQGEPGVKWAPEEVANGNKGIRWVSDEGVHGRPTDHDCRVYLESNPNARGCHCPECMLAAAPQPTEQQPAPDVAGLTEALRQYQHNDGSGLVFGYDRLLVDQCVAGLVEALVACARASSAAEVGWIVDAALAVYRKQEGNHDNQ